MQQIARRLMFVIAFALGMSCAAQAQTQSSSSSRSSSSTPAVIPPLPEGYVECAAQGQTCVFTGTRKVLIDNCFEYSCWNGAVTATDSWPCYGYIAMGTTRCAYSVARFDQLTGFTATASNQSGTSRSAAKAVDGDTATRWEASNSSAGNWLKIEGALFTPYRIEISESGSRIRDYRVEYLDGTVWVPLQSGSAVGGSLVIDRAKYAPVTTTALRIITTAPSAGQPSIIEFKVFGKTGAP